MMYHFSIFLLSILIVLSVIGNSLVVVSALCNRKLRKYTHILILNLAVSDLLISMFSLTFRLLRLMTSLKLINVPLIKTDLFCKYTTCATMTLFAVANFNLLLLTFDRFCAVNFVLAYKFNFKRSYMALLLASSWTLATMVGVIPILVTAVQQTANANDKDYVCTYGSVVNEGYAVFIIVFTFFAPLFIMIAMYVSIIKKVSESYNRDSLRRQSDAHLRTSLKPNIIRRRERRLSLGVLVLLCIHTICAAPISLLDLVQIFGKITAPPLAIEICLLLTYTNPVINAPTYAGASREYYETFVSMLCCCVSARKCCSCRKRYRRRRKECHPVQCMRINRGNNDIWHMHDIVRGATM